MRARTLIAVAALISGLVTVGVVSSSGNATPAVAPTAGGSYAPLTPVRIFDTGVKVAATGTVNETIAGKGGVPATGVSAVAITLTVTNEAAGGYLTAYPTGTTRPGTSNQNFVANKNMADLAIVKLGTGGQISIYNGSAGVIRVVGEVAGYYTSGTPSTPGAFQVIQPTRFLDTGTGNGAPKALVAAGATVSVQITGRGGVPTTGVGAVAVNVTAVGPAASGYLTAYPEGSARPGTSNVNYVKGVNAANLAVVKLGPTGKISIYNGSAGTIRIIGDVAGYYADGTATANGATTAVAPRRILDTTVGGTKFTKLHVLGVGGVPAAGVNSVALSVTAVGPTQPGNINTNVYGTSNISFYAGQTVAGLIIAKIDSFGDVYLMNNSGGNVRLIADLAGYTTDGTGSVSGKVTDSAGNPLGNVTVYAQPEGTTGGPYLSTKADGTFRFDGLVPGQWTLCYATMSATGGSTPATGYVGECHGDSPTISEHKTRPSATVSAATLAVDNTALASGGAVSGTLTDESGHPLAGVFVSVANTPGVWASTSTDAAGRYTLKSLPAGDVAVCFQGNAATGGVSTVGYVNECYDNAPEYQPSVRIPITAGQTVSGINASLTAAGVITGRVTDSVGAPVTSGSVDLWINQSSPYVAAVQTDGTYRITGVAPGTYTVESDAAGYLPQWYDHASTAEAATPVTVSGGSTSTANFSLNPE